MSPLLALHGHARHRAAHLALVDDDGRRWTFGDLWRHGEQLARSLTASGLHRGDGVLVAMDSSASAVATMLGSMIAGGVAIPLNTRLTAHETADFVDAVRPRSFVAGEAYADLVEGGLATTLDAIVGSGVHRRIDGDSYRIDGPDERQPALVLGTGGTTGTPKGAVFDHAALWAWTTSSAVNNHVRASDAELFVAPMFHGTFVTGLLTTLVTGGSARLMGRLDVDRAVAHLVSGNVTRVLGASTVIERLVDAVSATDQRQSRVRFVQFGMSSSRPGLARDIAAAFPGASVITGYGATEFGPVTRAYEWDLDLDGEPPGVGRPVPGVDVRVVGTDGREVGPGVDGEIVAWSPWQMTRYCGLDDQEARWNGHSIRSGDVGRFDDDGHLWLTGRAKDTIRSGGETVYPSEVEAVLQRHPDVLACAVFGMPDATWGERVHAAVVMRHAVQVDGLAEELRHRMAGFKVPKAWHVVDALPLTANHKVDRRALQAMAADITTSAEAARSPHTEERP